MCLPSTRCQHYSTTLCFIMTNVHGLDNTSKCPHNTQAEGAIITLDALADRKTVKDSSAVFQSTKPSISRALKTGFLPANKHHVEKVFLYITVSDSYPPVFLFCFQFSWTQLFPSQPYWRWVPLSILIPNVPIFCLVRANNSCWLSVGVKDRRGHCQ